LAASEKHTSLNGTGCVRNSWVSSAPTLDAGKGGHEIRCDLQPAFCLVIALGRILFTTVKEVFQRAPSLAAPR
jgi:hypothetical protein